MASGSLTTTPVAEDDTNAFTVIVTVEAGGTSTLAKVRRLPFTVGFCATPPTEPEPDW